MGRQNCVQRDIMEMNTSVVQFTWYHVPNALFFLNSLEETILKFKKSLNPQPYSQKYNQIYLLLASIEQH